VVSKRAGSALHDRAAQLPDRYRRHRPDLAGRRLCSGVADGLDGNLRPVRAGTNTHGNFHAYGHRDIHAYSHGHGNCDRYIHSDCDTNRNNNWDSNSNRDANGNSVPHANLCAATTQYGELVARGRQHQ
jgi:hypothetical protein